MDKSVTVCPENAARITALINEFDALIDNKLALFDDPGFTPEMYDRIEQDQLILAYRIVGAVEGSGLRAKS